eukprot:c38944_g1_i1 orf=63-398(+)
MVAFQKVRPCGLEKRSCEQSVRIYGFEPRLTREQWEVYRMEALSHTLINAVLNLLQQVDPRLSWCPLHSSTVCSRFALNPLPLEKLEIFGRSKLIFQRVGVLPAQLLDTQR